MKGMTKREKELRAIIGKAREEQDRIETARNLKENAKLVGQCFKYRNSYGGLRPNEKKWWSYKQITGLSEYGRLNGWQFDVDYEGKVVVERVEHTYVQDWLPISLREFAVAWEACQKTLLAFSPFKAEAPRV